MPLVVFILLAVVCLALLGLACACTSDQPAQAFERTLASGAELPALVELWPLLVPSLMSAGAVVLVVMPRSRSPSPAQLQRFLS